jgi:hypothetical protein
VPREAVVEEVVEDGHAGLVAEAVVLEDAVRLRLALRPALRPSVELKQKSPLLITVVLEDAVRLRLALRSALRPTVELKQINNSFN